ncbi:unnamed protein product [Hydatigera taeniaeformis]|uniref:V-type proton ATPase subunit H n=1 Tax=Hydatigena taeniaeformis TaxID=6205 RepID=A0A0R3WL48_HYDTA|nr:unnamed protein product [Hydatigera taeniaeformis]
MAHSVGLEKTTIQDLDYGAFQGRIEMTNLEGKVAEIRLSRVNWQSYLQGQMINQKQFDFISHLDNATTTEARTRVVNEFKGEVCDLLILTRFSGCALVCLNFESHFQGADAAEETSRVELFRQYFDSKSENIWNHFFNFLQRTDLICVYQVSKIITKFACWSTQRIDEKSLIYFFDWLLEKLQQPNNEYLQTVARNLQMLLRVRDYRSTFVTKQGVDVLIRVLSNKETNCELYYQLIFCLWCLSFNGDLVQIMVKNPTLLPAVCDAFCDAEREKVLRICMAFLRSVLEKLDDPALMRECSLRMVQCKALKRLELLSQKDLSHDPEMTEDLKFLQETLKASVQDVSSLEEYTTELTSGRLEWSPVHKSEKFWRENAVKFTENNYELLKMLVYLMESSTETVILSVAAHDVGEFVRHYPRGKQVIDQLGGKQVVMSLLQHHDPSVRYNALLALQKIMVHNWEYLGKQLETQKATSGASSTSVAKVK